MRLRIIVALVLVAGRVSVGQEHAHAASERLGTVHFASSCTPAAQRELDRAVALLHSFEFRSAIAGFQAALRATRWKGKPAILGYDLINEPHGKLPTWGGYDGTPDSTTDIRAMYIRAGDAIHAVDPDPLIIAEGVQNYPGKAFEGDLRGVPKWPVTLKTANKVVYSVHIYPAEVSDAPKDYGASWIERMNRIWGFLVTRNVAPVFVGECGDWLNTDDSRRWAAAFVSYINGNAPGGIRIRRRGQPVSWSWWDWDVNESGGAIPDFGVLTSWRNGRLRPEQASVLKQMFFRRAGSW